VRGHGQRTADHKFGDTHPDAIRLCARLDQHLQGLLIVDIEADPLQDLQRGEVNLLALLPSHARVVRAGHVGLMRCDH